MNNDTRLDYSDAYPETDKCPVCGSFLAMTEAQQREDYLHTQLEIKEKLLKEACEAILQIAHDDGIKPEELPEAIKILVKENIKWYDKSGKRLMENLKLKEEIKRLKE